MPRMPARVFAALLSTDDGARTAAELAQQMQVSPAAISGAVRYLMQVGMVTRDREPGYGATCTASTATSGSRCSRSATSCTPRWIDSLRNGIDAVGASTPAGGRLDETMRFFDFLRVEMPVLIEHWHERSGAAPRRTTAH